jgi:hypothetical protein
MDLTFIIQVCGAAFFAFCLGVWANTKHADYLPPTGIIETVMLATFAEKNLPPAYIRELAPLHSVQDSDEERLRRRAGFYKTFLDQGVLSHEDVLPAADTKTRNWFVDTLLFAIIAILMLVFMPFMFLIYRKDCAERRGSQDFSMLIHPDERAHLFLQIVGAVLSLFVFSVIVWVLVPGGFRLVLVTCLALEIAYLLSSLARLALNQERWKNFWTDKLSVVMQRATNANDHDLYNRAATLLTRIEGYPTVPLTSLQRAVLVLFALVQFVGPPVVNWISSNTPASP